MQSVYTPQGRPRAAKADRGRVSQPPIAGRAKTEHQGSRRANGASATAGKKPPRARETSQREAADPIRPENPPIQADCRTAAEAKDGHG